MEAGETLIVKLEQQIRQEQLLTKGEHVVVAVSGGADSVALLHLLWSLADRFGWRLTAAHVNHGFRPAESEREAELVERLAARLSVPLETAHLDMPAELRRAGGNPQAAAREARYRFLGDVAKRTGAGKVALAHHADDQAETVLMRVIRGTGPSGLGGMPIRRFLEDGVELVRPMLRINKKEVVRYCEEQALEYCIDSSNLDPKYFRNRVRLEMLPALARYNEQLPSALNRMAEVIREEDDYLVRETQGLYERFVREEKGAKTWSAAWFAGVHVALQRRLIKLILSYLACESDSLDFQQVEWIRNALIKPTPSNFRREIAPGVLLSREYDRIAVHTMVLSPSPYAYQVAEGELQLYVPETRSTLALTWTGPPDTGCPDFKDPYTACYDADALSFPLTVRSRLSGDRFRPYGLKGTKKVKDMFIDAKVPPRIRELLPVVTDATGNILWLPGVRRSGDAIATAHTRRWLHMKLHNDFILK